MNNDEIFEDFWANYQWPEIKPIFYRLYYDEESGRPLNYSMEELPGKYIDITPEQYAQASSRVRVKNGQLVPLPKPLPPKLVPADEGTPCHPDAVDVVVSIDKPNQKWKLRYATESN